jgi:hypothetical protein
MNRVACTSVLLLLVGCEGRFTNDLGTAAPADPGIVEVNVGLLGIEFETSGGTRTIDFRDAEPVDLAELADGEPLRMFTDETLDEGAYAGVRLLFDEDFAASVVDETGAEFPLSLAEGAFAELDFRVEDDDRSRHAYTLTLDLRQSLAFDDDTGEYTLTPVLRAVETRRAAEVEGAVDVDCDSGDSLRTNGAVYLFAGRGVTPDDLDGAGAEPYATASVTVGTGNETRYALRNLEPGDYTIGVTCRGDAEAPGRDDDLRFRGVRNLSLDDGDTRGLDLD